MPSIWRPDVSIVKALVDAVPELLDTQKPDGRFNDEPWICSDQNAIYPLAAAWAMDYSANPFRRDPRLLDAVMAGGDVLIDEADPDGMWTFRKKDHSTWGQTYMPWTYSRWARAFMLVRDAMPQARRKRWEDALVHGYTGIAKTCLGHVHNIPAHHAMGLYAAGCAFERDDWRTQAREFMAQVVAAQHPDGYWSEHFGPVVVYNYVYCESLGIYCAMSHDPVALDALRRAAIFHANFTYPDGSSVETVDERNPYHETIRIGNVGFTFSPEGRGHLLRQTELLGRSGASVDADAAASLVLYGQAGEAAAVAGEQDDCSFVLGDRDALVRRSKPWFICLSAFACEPPKSRWQQDRQNYVSLFHDDAGLFAGGGNTKLQPLLSTFTVGDPSLLHHTPGDETPDFLPDIDLLWYATGAKLLDDPPGLALTYGDETCTVRVELHDAARATVTFESTCRTGKPVEAHLPLLYRDDELRANSGLRARLGEEPLEWTAEAAGGGVQFGKVQLAMPAGSRLEWPARMHNPYAKDGSAATETSRLALCMPLTPSRSRVGVEIKVVDNPSL